MEPLFVFTADLHLEDGAWSTRPGIYGDAYYSFAQIIDYCVANKLPLILGGDVLDKKSNSARPIAKLCHGMDRMRTAGLPVFYIQGNHEYDRNAPWLSVHDWPRHIHGQTIDINGASVYGLDWLPKGEIQQALAAAPAASHILVTHQVWEDFMKGVGRTECSLADVHHVKTVLAGDFHITTTAEGTGAQGQPVMMFSPGSICMQDCSECPQKYFFVIGRKPDGSFGVEMQALITRPFKQYLVNSQELLDGLCAGQLATDIETLRETVTAPDGIDKPIIRIKFDKRLPDAYLRLATAVGESAHLFCEALPDRSESVSKATTRSSSKNELLAALSDLLGESTDAYKLAAALVAAEDPVKELDAYFVKFQEETSNAVATLGSSELGTPSPAGM